MIKNILCFGASQTWGWNPENATRYPFDKRWTGVLQNKLGANYHIIEEGLNGRTTVFDDPFQPGRNGSLILPVLLESHAPLDLVILFLGTNDLKPYIQNSTKDGAKKAALGCIRLIRLIWASQCGPKGNKPDILLLSPPWIIEPKGLMEMVFIDVVDESKELAKHYESVARNFNIHFMDLSQFIKPSPIDGIHMDVHNNKILGEKLALTIQEIYKI
ncbi:MAG: SGNH/GDSL hydrolase family protein [Alphaproteobacteria bacterium]|nr:SGNH/GDSL hydrolase family protein [Alphaproteobacteria bacterium]